MLVVSPGISDTERDNQSKGLTNVIELVSPFGGERLPDLDGRVIPDDTLGILCVFAEARSEPYEGQVAVGSVVRNRTRLHFYSKGTVASTVFSPYQFSWANTGDAQRVRVFEACRNDPAWAVASKAWFESEFTYPVGEDALWYHSDLVHPEWAKASGIELVRRIGRHLFYRRAQ